MIAAPNVTEILPDVDRLRWSRTWDLSGDMMLAFDLTILFLMIRKPFA